jgi:hypothetical protein
LYQAAFGTAMWRNMFIGVTFSRYSEAEVQGGKFLRKHNESKIENILKRKLLEEVII